MEVATMKGRLPGGVLRLLPVVAAVGLGVAALMLLLALGRHPYSYYVTLRWAVCLLMALAAVVAFVIGRPYPGVVSVVLALLFNPVVPFRLDRSTWQTLDLAAAVAAAVMAVAIGRPQQPRQT
jgi:hypothetical protein